MNPDRFIAICSLAVAILAGIPAWLPYVSTIQFGSFFGSPVVRLLSIVAMLFLSAFAGWKLNDSVRSNILTSSADINERNKQTIDRLDGNLRLLLSAVQTKRSVFASSKDWSNYIELDQPFFSQFINWKNLANGNVQLSPTKTLDKICSANPDIFEDVTEEAIRAHGITHEEARRIIGRYSNGFLHWWYWLD